MQWCLTMSALELTLTLPYWSRHNNNPWGVICHNDKCKKHLKVNERAVSIRVNNNGHHRALYCVECAKRLCII